MKKNEQILLQIILNSPHYVFWKDKELKYQGCSYSFAKYLDLSSPDEILGKTDYELPWAKKYADQYRAEDKEVIDKGISIFSKKVHIGYDADEKEEKIFSISKVPLTIDNRIEGVLCNCIDITKEELENLALLNRSKKLSKYIKDFYFNKTGDRLSSTTPENYIRELFGYYDSIIGCMPGNVYWLNRNCVLIGGNDNLAKMFGLKSRFELIGLTYEQMSAYANWTEGQGDHFKNIELEVMKSGIPKLGIEEPPVIINGEKKYYLGNKVPIFDSKKKVVGVAGISVDITDKKNAEYLKLENEKHKATEKIQKEFQKEVNQVVHDIRSPLASLEMLATYATQIPEKERENFRRIATTISDIANNFLNKHNPPLGKADSAGIEQDQARSIVVALLLQQLLSEKRFEYQSSSVEFALKIEPSHYFACLAIQPLALKRALSNLINNAVEALDSKSGKITLELTVDSENIAIKVTDNGKGMPESVKSKILQGVSVTAGKAEGHGIGMGQVLEMVKRNNGELTINSVLEQGTSIQLQFKMVSPPNWLATEINLRTTSLVVVLDDDDSIHQAWDARLIPLHQKYPSILIHHFKRADETLSFIKQLTPVQHNRLFLLSDYELLNQNQNGLEVIEAAQPCFAVLVTSHYNNPSLQKATTGLSLRILPKELASKVPINLSQVIQDTDESGAENGSVFTPDKNNQQDAPIKTVDLVLVEDNALFASQCLELLFADNTVDHYLLPEELLKNLSQYPKDTRFALDNNYEGSALNGKELADQLHQAGYTRLYLLSGDALNSDDLPDYLTAFLKNSQGLEALKGVIAGKSPIPPTPEKQREIAKTKGQETKTNSNTDFLGGIMGFIQRIVHDVRSPLMALGLGNKTLSEVLPILLATYTNPNSAENNTLNTDESTDRKIKQLLRFQAEGDEVHDASSIERLNQINDTVWRNFHNLLEKRLDPQGFTACKIYHVIQYAMAICAFNSQERQSIKWERETFFNFRGNEIASIELFKKLLTGLMEQIDTGRYQNLTITQNLGDTHHAVHLKLTANAPSADTPDSSSIHESENDLQQSIMELANRLEIKLERQPAENHDVEWVVFFPALRKPKADEARQESDHAI